MVLLWLGIMGAFAIAARVVRGDNELPGGWVDGWMWLFLFEGFAGGVCLTLLVLTFPRKSRRHR